MFTINLCACMLSSRLYVVQLSVNISLNITHFLLNVFLNIRPFSLLTILQLCLFASFLRTNFPPVYSWIPPPGPNSSSLIFPASSISTQFPNTFTTHCHVSSFPSIFPPRCSSVIFPMVLLLRSTRSLQFNIRFKNSIFAFKFCL